METLKTRFILLHTLLVILPRNSISLMTGWMARLRLPGLLQGLANSLFVRIFGLNMAEANLPDPSAYSSIEDLFIRPLRPGIRPVQSRYVSPADGYLAWSAPLRHGAAIQAKGIDYNPAELVWGIEAASHEHEAADLAWFTTVYLAPHNYHRVHSPVSGHVISVRYIPGDLWPVNEPFVGFFPDLFTRNERLVFEIALEGHPGAMAYVVMVGAFNVGRMTTHLIPGFATNNDLFREIARRTHQRVWHLSSPWSGPATNAAPVTVAGGDELGAFLLGSTVVIVLNKTAAGVLKPVQDSGNKPILMGRTLNVNGNAQA